MVRDRRAAFCAGQSEPDRIVLACEGIAELGGVRSYTDWGMTLSWLNTYSLALLCLSSVTLLTPDAAAGAANPDGEQVPTNRSAQVPVQEFQITAERFQFAPSTIEVNQGDTVRLVVRSVDVAHGFRLDGHMCRQPHLHR